MFHLTCFFYIPRSAQFSVGALSYFKHTRDTFGRLDEVTISKLHGIQYIVKLQSIIYAWRRVLCLKEVVLRVEVRGNRALVGVSNPRLSWKLPDPTYLLHQTFAERLVSAFTTVHNTLVWPHIKYGVNRETAMHMYITVIWRRDTYRKSAISLAMKDYGSWVYSLWSLGSSPQSIHCSATTTQF